MTGKRVRVRTARGRPIGSQRWLERQLNDPYVEQAKRAGYRSRAAFKLEQIDDKHRLLRRGARVLDLGAAPGGWAQVAAARGCRVAAFDLMEIAPIAGVTILTGDLFDPATPGRLLDVLGGHADVLLSDIAAPATGQRAVDRLRAEAVAEAVVDLAPTLLASGGHMLIKLVRGAEQGVMAALKQDFATARLVRPAATRKESSEIYLLGLGYRAQSSAGTSAGDD
jgi:23S rRNA (uridine2552-2'-O)-methyltransferase